MICGSVALGFVCWGHGGCASSLFDSGYCILVVETSCKSYFDGQNIVIVRCHVQLSRNPVQFKVVFDRRTIVLVHDDFFSSRKFEPDTRSWSFSSTGLRQLEFFFIGGAGEVETIRGVERAAKQRFRGRPRRSMLLGMLKGGRANNSR